MSTVGATGPPGGVAGAGERGGCGRSARVAAGGPQPLARQVCAAAGGRAGASRAEPRRRVCGWRVRVCACARRGDGARAGRAARAPAAGEEEEEEGAGPDGDGGRTGGGSRRA